MNQILNIFKALSDKTRLRIMSALVRADKALCICEIMDSLELPQYTISKHVKELKIAGLVGEERIGRFVFYELKKPVDGFHKHMTAILESSLSDVFPEDNKRLKKRLSARKNDQCVIGMKKCGFKG
jgi:ArsR family transcriptional regulator